MEINNAHAKAEVSGITSSKFGFEMNAKMYDILISKMYTNKQGAVIRELSANAWDAHVDAGNQDTPFELHLPTWLDKSFSIRDYGTGIPHHLFEHIYTNVGSSTKEDTNEFIGGFGLGSKTPFTMTDTFMVENWNAGIKTTWVCFKDKGEPQVSKLSEEPSDDPSGLKVSFSFDEADVDEFTKQVVRQLRFFPVKPTITGGNGDIKFPELPDGWETKNYFYTETDHSYTADNYLVMGNVAYTLDPYEFDYQLRDLFRKGLTIKVPIGAVDIPPSRETLEMTPRTKAYIIQMLDEIKEQYAVDTQATIDLCATEWDLRKVVFNLNTSLLKEKDVDALAWKGGDINWSKLRKSWVDDIAGYRPKAIVRSYKNVYRATSFNMSKALNGDLTYYVNDLGPRGSAHINAEHNKHLIGGLVIFHVEGVTDKTRDTLVPQAIKAITAELNTEPTLLSSLFGFPPAPVKSAVPKGKTETNQVFLLEGSPDSNSSLKNQMTEQQDMPTDGYYVELKMWGLVTDIPNLRRALAQGLTYFLGKPLYVVRSKTIGKLAPSVKLLTVDVLNTLEQSVIDKYKKVTYSRALQSYVHVVSPSHKPLVNALKDKVPKVYFRYALYLGKKAVSYKGSPHSLYSTLYGKDIEYDVEIPEKLTNMRDKYEPINELLTSVCNSYSRERNERNVNTIANFILNNQ